MVVRWTTVLHHVKIPIASWYHRPVQDHERRSPGPARKPIPDAIRCVVKNLAHQHPWWGYKRIAVIARRNGTRVSNKITYKIFQEEGLLQCKRPSTPALYQAAKLAELLPTGVNELWQTDVTYLNIPGRGWWYAVTVIDYYSRYLLALHLTPSYRAADVTIALDLARSEAERLHGPLQHTPFLVTDNGTSFTAKAFQRHVAGAYEHLRIQYRTPTQLGLLERFHQTLNTEEIYWNLYKNPAEARVKLEAFRIRYNEIRPHWALKPEAGGDPATPLEVYTNLVTPRLPAWQDWAIRAKERLAIALNDDTINHQAA